MPSLLKRGRKSGEAGNGTSPEPMPQGEAMAHAEAAPTTHMPPAEGPTDEAPRPRPQPAPAQATYTPPPGADDFQLPETFVPAEPPPSEEPTRRPGGLLARVLGDPGEQTPEERDRVAAMEFEQAIAPVMEYMRAAVPEASTPEEAARILAANQGEITPDPQGGAYVYGDAFDHDARVYYRLLRRDYEKNPRPSQKRSVSHHLHGVYGKLTGTKGW